MPFRGWGGEGRLKRLPTCVDDAASASYGASMTCVSAESGDVGWERHERKNCLLPWAALLVWPAWLLRVVLTAACGAV